MKYILAFDQGTTSSRTIVFNEQMKIVSIAQREFRQIYPQPGWVEHDPFDILGTQLETMREAVAKAGVNSGDIVAAAIANQRETVVVWDKKTGRPVYNAIVWQCRRSADFCSRLRAEGVEGEIVRRTGLLADAYFSGTKIKWILDNVPGARSQAEAGNLLFGTIDAWLVWNLTAHNNHLTDVTNASRTMLFNIHNMKWDDEMLRILGVPGSMLPDVLPCTADFGRLRRDILGREIPIRGMAGDQQAALFGQACHRQGEAKNTYGTGCFLLMNTGGKPASSKSRLLTTVAWDAGDGPVYALEGSVFTGGAAVQWLRDGLCLIRTAAETEELALSVPSSDGVYLVPAFSGLGAPWWDMYARGTIVGITRGTGREHIVRAALEAIAYQSADMLQAMEADAGIRLSALKVDGGASANNFLMQFQSDLLGRPVVRPSCLETTAMGVACFAGLGTGLLADLSAIAKLCHAEKEFQPSPQAGLAQASFAGWHKAVGRAKNWIEHE